MSLLHEKEILLNKDIEDVEKPIVIEEKEEPNVLEFALEINEAITENMKALFSDLVLEIRDSENIIVGYGQFADSETLKKNFAKQKRKFIHSSIELKGLHTQLIRTIKMPEDKKSEKK